MDKAFPLPIERRARRASSASSSSPRPESGEKSESGSAQPSDESVKRPQVRTRVLARASNARAPGAPGTFDDSSLVESSSSDSERGQPPGGFPGIVISKRLAFARQKESGPYQRRTAGEVLFEGINPKPLHDASVGIETGRRKTPRWLGKLKPARKPHSVKHWTNVRIDGFSPLHRAVQAGALEDVAYLVKQGANMNLPVDRTNAMPKKADDALDQLTPLMLAIDHGFNDIARCLLQHGARSDHGNPKDGMTALMRAAKTRNMEIVEILLDRKPEFPRKDRHGIIRPENYENEIERAALIALNDYRDSDDADLCFRLLASVRPQWFNAYRKFSGPAADIYWAVGQPDIIMCAFNTGVFVDEAPDSEFVTSMLGQLAVEAATAPADLAKYLENFHGWRDEVVQAFIAAARPVELGPLEPRQTFYFNDLARWMAEHNKQELNNLVMFHQLYTSSLRKLCKDPKPAHPGIFSNTVEQHKFNIRLSVWQQAKYLIDAATAASPCLQHHPNTSLAHLLFSRFEHHQFIARHFGGPHRRLPAEHMPESVCDIISSEWYQVLMNRAHVALDETGKRELLDALRDRLTVRLLKSGPMSENTRRCLIDLLDALFC